MLLAGGMLWMLSSSQHWWYAGISHRKHCHRFFVASGSGFRSKTSVSPKQIWKRSTRRARMQQQEVDSRFQLQNQGNDSDYALLNQLSTAYDELTILQSAEKSSSKYAGYTLLVNNSGNIHSMYKVNSVWTDLYFFDFWKRDEFATLPAVVPKGPIATLRLGGGTVARILLNVWPSRILEGWEIEVVGSTPPTRQNVPLVDKARLHFALPALESPSREGGSLSVHVDDALSSETTVNGGFAGIVLDSFYQGEVLPQLQKAQGRIELKERLKPGGCLTVNCGGTCVERRDFPSAFDDRTRT